MRQTRRSPLSADLDGGAAKPPAPPPRRNVRLLPAVLAVLGVAVLVGCAILVAVRHTGSSSPPSGQPGPTPAGSSPAGNGPAAPSSGALLGAWVKPEQADAGNGTAAVQTLQQGIDRRLDIVHVYRKWDEPFPGQTERAAIQQGSTPMISWAGTNTAAITAGSYDDLIRQRARDVKALGVPILLRWSWEMDRPGQAGKVGSGADYVAAWRHIRAVFTAEGATNAGWVWCPTAFGFKQGRVDQYYPGDKEVDWLCADGYTGPSVGGWRSFEQVFRAFYDWSSSHPQPLMVGEFGVPAGSPGQRAAWLKAAGQTLQTTFPRIKAVVYFDAIRVDNNGQRNIWTLRGYPDALAAFAALAREPYFNTRRLPALR